MRRIAGGGKILVAFAGVLVNVVLAIAAYSFWRRAAGDTVRIISWLIWVSQAFVASGYLVFSGATGFGDLGIGNGGSLANLGLTWPVRIIEIVIGGASYVLLVRAAIRALDTMIGTGPETRRVRRLIAHVYYGSVGTAAVIVGLLNPVGIVITIMSAAASSFGGLAGFISIGYSVTNDGEPKPIALGRNLLVVVAGIAVLTAFALILGPSVHFSEH